MILFRANLILSAPFHLVSNGRRRGYLFLAGRFAITESIRLMALDADTGQRVWGGERGGFDVLYATSSGLYVGMGGFSKLLYKRLETGETIWSTSLPNARSVSIIYPADGLVYANTFGGYRLVSEKDRAVIFQQSRGNLNLDWLKKLEAEIGTAIDPDYFYVLVSGGGTILLSDGVIRDARTKQALWDINDPDLSIIRLASSETMLFILTRNGNVEGRDLRTGAMFSSIGIDPSTLPPSDGEGHGNTYRLAVDKDENLLYIYLGDTKQLFALDIS